MATHVGIDAQVDQDSPEPLIKRHFTTAGHNPLDQITWTRRDVWVGSKYEHLDVEAPDFWSDNAVAITSKLYLSKAEGSREHSVRALVERVAAKIVIEAMRHGYFGDDYTDVGEVFLDPVDSHERRLMIITRFMLDEPPLIFFDELCYVMANQVAIFNSPVLFNVGRDDRPQSASACYLMDLDDTTDSIMTWLRDESFIFKSGAGAGSNVSKLRGSMESLSTGGWASGPVSFMRLSNASAETFKSGGVTRRAARMIVLNADHPDIRDFITCKVREEERIQALADAGINVSMDEEGERNVAEATSFQAANNSVSVTDEFMRRATDGITATVWPLIARKSGAVVAIDDADSLLDLIAQSTRVCADPGMYFYDTVNAWHTTPNDAPITHPNPCCEVQTPPNSSCNLASINALKFVRDDGSFEVESFRHVVDVMITAMDVLVQFCITPNDLITERTEQYRWLGLGYANMGAAIMAQGLAYDSDAGRDFAASVTSLMTGRAYCRSSRLARHLAPFSGFDENRSAMLAVLRKHANNLPGDGGGDVWNAADMDWLEALAHGSVYGYRNAQATVIAPTGTISFFMDCDTTGIEPAFELVTHKDLAGGGDMTIENMSVHRALHKIGLDPYAKILREQGADAFTQALPEEYRAIFHGANQISAEGHIRMIAAIQPFLSGSSSKTINMPSVTTWQEIRDAYVMAWRLGVKALAIYRDGSKARQPHAAVKKAEPEHDLVVDESTDEEFKVTATSTFGAPKATEIPMSVVWPEGGLKRGTDADYVTPERHLLPRTRRSLTHKIHLRGPMGDYKGYVHAGMYDDGRFAELFIDGFGRAGSFTLNALARWGTAYSKAIQYGIPWQDFARDSLGVADETGGMVVPESGDSVAPPIRSAKSVFDYIVRWLALEFGDDDLRAEFGVRVLERREDVPSSFRAVDVDDELVPFGVIKEEMTTGGDAGGRIIGPICGGCGGHMRVTGGCFTCPSCLTTTGCG